MIDRDSPELRRIVREAQGYVHPDVEPRFYVGSLVTHQGVAGNWRVTRRSIDWNGVVRYEVEPVDAPSIVSEDPVTGERQEVDGAVTVLSGDRVGELPEAALSPLRPFHETVGAANSASLVVAPHDEIMLTEQAAAKEVE